MQCYVDCVHCYQKQAANCMSIAGVEEDRQYQVLYNFGDYITGGMIFVFQLSGR